jgi:hypothetical protein
MQIEDISLTILVMGLWQSVEGVTLAIIVVGAS